MAIRVIFGLGNPGPKYERTRHNVGFLVVDALAEKLRPLRGLPLEAQHFRRVSRFDAEILRMEEAYLVKPLTYMNRSGVTVAAVTHFYRIAADELLVIYDDMDLPLGRLRLRERGSSGGHNGIKSIIQQLGTDQFPRLKVGIGRREREDGSGSEAISHVLGTFSAEEAKDLPGLSGHAADAALCALREGVPVAMNRFNGSDYGKAN